MKVLVFLIIVITPAGDFEVTSDVVQACPDKARFMEVMNKRQAQGEIRGWNAMCTHFDVAQMMGVTS